MENTINIKQLRTTLKNILKKVSRGESFLVLYRSRPAFRIVPPRASDMELIPLENEPLYRAKAIGKSDSGRASQDHDQILYGDSD